MALAGITSVGEFHYLHHGPGGTPYDDPNAMGTRSSRPRARPGCGSRCWTPATSPAASAGRSTGVQRRFGDGDADALGRRGSSAATAAPARRRGDRRGRSTRSARCPRDQIGDRRAWAAAHERTAARRTCPSRSPRTTPASRRTAATPPRCWTSPARSAPRTTAVHATHLTDARRRAARRRRHRTSASARRPSATSADGIGPARALRDAGSPLTLGSDSHAVDRPVRGDAGGRAGRAAGHPAARPLVGRRAAARRHRDGHASLGFARRRPHRGRRARRPGRRRH